MQHRIKSPTWHRCSQLQYDGKDPEGCGPAENRRPHFLEIDV